MLCTSAFIRINRKLAGGNVVAGFSNPRSCTPFMLYLVCAPQSVSNIRRVTRVCDYVIVYVDTVCIWDENEQKWQCVTYDEFEQQGVQNYLDRKMHEQKHTIDSVIQR